MKKSSRHSLPSFGYRFSPLFRLECSDSPSPPLSPPPAFIFSLSSASPDSVGFSLTTLSTPLFPAPREPTLPPPAPYDSTPSRRQPASFAVPETTSTPAGADGPPSVEMLPPEFLASSTVFMDNLFGSAAVVVCIETPTRGGGRLTFEFDN